MPRQCHIHCPPLQQECQKCNTLGCHHICRSGVLNPYFWDESDRVSGVNFKPPQNFRFKRVNVQPCRRRIVSRGASPKAASVGPSTVPTTSSLS